MKKDLTPTNERRVLQEIRELEKKDLIPRNMAMRLKPSASKPPKLYGFPKIHKPQVPLHLIVSCINSPLIDKHHTISKTQSFAEIVRSIRLQPTEAMVSFDIKSLFTNVPIQEALEVIQEKLMNDESLEERTALTAEQISHLLDLCLRTTYFLYTDHTTSRKMEQPWDHQYIGSLYTVSLL